jgi:hypothetical protein
MSAVQSLKGSEADPRVNAVFDDIRATRINDLIKNRWPCLAFDVRLMDQIRAEVRRVTMVPSALGPVFHRA